MKCLHIDVNDDGFCVACCVEVTSRIDAPIIEPSVLETTSLPQELKSELGNCKTGKDIFREACIIGLPQGSVDPRRLLQELHINSRAVNHCVRNISGTSGNTEDEINIPVVAMLPEKYIIQHLSLIDKGELRLVEKYGDRLTKFAEKVTRKFRQLTNFRGEFVSAAMILYYFQHIAAREDKEVAGKIKISAISARTGISAASISSVHKKLCSALNRA